MYKITTPPIGEFPSPRRLFGNVAVAIRPLTTAVRPPRLDTSDQTIKNPSGLWSLSGSTAVATSPSELTPKTAIFAPASLDFYTTRPSISVRRCINLPPLNTRTSRQDSIHDRDSHFDCESQQSSPVPPPTAAIIDSIQQVTRQLNSITNTYASKKHTMYLAFSSGPQTSPSSILPCHGHWRSRYSRPPLTRLRKAVIWGALLLVLASLIALILFFFVVHTRTPANGRLVMMWMASIVLLSAMAMLAARRCIKEVLVMAAVGATLCQCLMAGYVESVEQPK